MNALILRRAGKTEEPFAGHLSTGRVIHIGLTADVRLAPVRRLPADDEVFGQHWAPLPGNLDLRAFGGLTPFVVVEHAAIHVVAAVVRLLASPCGVFVVTLRVVVLSRRLCGEQQEQSNNQMHYADITPILRFRFVSQPTYRSPAAKCDVRFTPNSDRESEFTQKSCLLYP